MGDPHNPNKAGEVWNQERIDYALSELLIINAFTPIIISGGWAWHFMSPKNHKELKINHDHKDIDVFIKPAEFNKLRETFEFYGYQRTKTQWDDPSGNFVRYVKHYATIKKVSDTGFKNKDAKVGQIQPNKVVFDVFLEDVKYIKVDEYKIVEPNTLLSYYGVKHSSEECTAVQAARQLVKKGISPINRLELIGQKHKEINV